MKTLRPSDETTDAVREQICFLHASCKAFDDGEIRESKRIATSLRVLLHHTADTPRGNSHALLGQVGVLDGLLILDSAGEVDLERPESTFTLTAIHMKVHGDHEGFQNSFVPKFDGDGPYAQPDPRAQIHALLNGSKAGRAPGLHIPFPRWWKQTVINGPKGQKFNRKGLVLAVANQDGGAHVDPALDADYYELTRLNALEVYAGGNKEQMYLSWGRPDPQVENAELTSAGSPVPASLRQIAWELIKSLEGRHPDLMP